MDNQERQKTFGTGDTERRQTKQNKKQKQNGKTEKKK
jgi:hypothetical protein